MLRRFVIYVYNKCLYNASFHHHLNMLLKNDTPIHHLNLFIIVNKNASVNHHLKNATSVHHLNL